MLRAEPRRFDVKMFPSELELVLHHQIERVEKAEERCRFNQDAFDTGAGSFHGFFLLVEDRGIVIGPAIGKPPAEARCSASNTSSTDLPSPLGPSAKIPSSG
jgi:hypothetical protein